MRALWLDRPNHSHNVSQMFKCIRGFFESSNPDTCFEIHNFLLLLFFSVGVVLVCVCVCGFRRFVIVLVHNERQNRRQQQEDNPGRKAHPMHRVFPLQGVPFQGLLVHVYWHATYHELRQDYPINFTKKNLGKSKGNGTKT